MELKSNRFWCYQNEVIFSFDEMTDLIQSDTRFPIRVGEAIIIAWVNLLRSEVLQLTDHDQAYSLAIQRGEGIFRLRRSLIPENWTKDSFGHQVARRTGLSFSTVCSTFLKMSEILTNLNGEKAFEPIGWFEVLPMAKGFEVHLWEDFLQPVSDEFEEETSLSSQLV